MTSSHRVNDIPAITKRFPTVSILPGGYRILIRRVPPTQIEEHYVCRNCGTPEPGEDTRPDGFWDVSHQTIWINNSSSKRRQWYVLTHEFGHAYIDWQHWAFDEGYAKP